MRRAFLLAGGVVAIGAMFNAPLLGAGPNAAAEAAIRKIVATENDGHLPPQMTDRIAWAGAIQKPVIGNERPLAAETAQVRLADRVSTKAVRTPVRIVVSNSGDLAYEYETAVVTIALKDGSTRKIDSAAVHVWQKDGAQWKLAVDFAAPLRK